MTRSEGKDGCCFRERGRGGAGALLGKVDARVGSTITPVFMILKRQCGSSSSGSSSSGSSSSGSSSSSSSSNDVQCQGTFMQSKQTESLLFKARPSSSPLPPRPCETWSVHSANHEL